MCQQFALNTTFAPTTVVLQSLKNKASLSTNLHLGICVCMISVKDMATHYKESPLSLQKVSLKGVQFSNGPTGMEEVVFYGISIMYCFTVGGSVCNSNQCVT